MPATVAGSSSDIISITATRCDEDGNVVTSHTTEPVPFIVTKENIRLKNGKLSDIAPTMLYLLGLSKPIEMTGDNLIEE